MALLPNAIVLPFSPPAYRSDFDKKRTGLGKPKRAIEAEQQTPRDLTQRTSSFRRLVTVPTVEKRKKKRKSNQSEAPCKPALANEISNHGRRIGGNDPSADGIHLVQQIPSRESLPAEITTVRLGRCPRPLAPTGWAIRAWKTMSQFGRR
ncbi:hypothetical protein TTRE_0000446201 [Trichuris trichiura]|uniref:Uncharacterized protein n=1 Tax=Trichuris trichiura TaxID=36087 RepID=A0A077Z6Y2_TRITR|nr:hypothetical protein TTRE_0000446201 [Trichuris trichiura]